LNEFGNFCTISFEQTETIIKTEPPTDTTFVVLKTSFDKNKTNIGLLHSHMHSPIYGYPNNIRRFRALISSHRPYTQL